MTRSFHLAPVIAVVVAIACPCGSTFAQATPAVAPSSPALSQDKHAGLTISVDPYTDPHRSKDKFGKSANPVPVGILPVDVYFKNDTPHAMRVNLETVQLEVKSGEETHQYVDWLTVGQVANMIRHPGGSSSAPSARRFPVGIPVPGKDKKVDTIVDQLRPFVLNSNVIPPLGTIHGFLFFDVSHDFSAAQKASLYLPDVVLLPDDTPLMFFEVPLTKGSATMD